MAAAILLFCFQGAGRKLSTEYRPSAEKARRLGAKGTKEQGFAGVCAPSPDRKNRKSRHGRRFGSRSVSRKANKFSFCARTPVLRRAESRPGRRFGSRSAARKANKFGFCAQTPVLRRAESWPAGRHLQLIRRPPKNNKKTSNLSCSSVVRDQGFEPWTP